MMITSVIIDIGIIFTYSTYHCEHLFYLWVILLFISHVISKYHTKIVGTQYVLCNLCFDIFIYVNYILIL